MSLITVGSRTFKDANALEKLVIYAATEYDINGYVEDFDGTEVTDPEYDALIRELKTRKPTSVAFDGTSPSKASAKGDIVVHIPPMTSIEKADGEPKEKEDIYDKWKSDCEALMGSEPEFVQSYKHDGVALRVNYVKGKLVSAGLRPKDGINGSDVTRHMKYVHGIPEKLPLPLTLSLNGEIECHLTDFEKINKACDAAGEELWANPRNYTAGCLNRDDAEENKDGCLRVAFYSITGFNEWSDHYTTELERAKWANSKSGLNLQDKAGKGYFVRVLLHKDYSQLEKMEAYAKSLPYYTDGVVLKVNDLQEQEELGHHGDDPIKAPRGAIAWKYAEETTEGDVSSVEWNASRTGRIVPTGVFDTPFILADTKNTRATCNNYGWMQSKGLGPGARVKLKKGGKIIPNIMEVITPVSDIGAPTHCPTCNFQLRLHTSDSGNKDLQCANNNCAAKHVQGWIHYLQIMGCKGLGTAALYQILNSGKVQKIADLYNLTVDDLMPHGFSERQALLALATIHKVKPIDNNDKLAANIEKASKIKQSIPAWQLFAALGIPGAGKTAGKSLVDHFRDFDKIRNATQSELEGIGGIGATTAKAVAEYFKTHVTPVNALLKKFDLELPKTGKLSGTTFVLTGAFDGGKETWHKKIEDVGGSIVGSVSKANYLVAGDNVGAAKTKKAKELGVPIIDLDELAKML